MKKFALKYGRWAFGAFAGAFAGFLYWRFVGCSGGTCSITSDPYNSMVYFALMGILLVSSVSKKKPLQSNDN